MANQELKIDGNTIIKLVNSDVHTISTLLNGFSGTVYWVVVNGICFIRVFNLLRSTVQTNVNVCAVPKRKDVFDAYAYFVYSDSTRGRFSITSDGYLQFNWSKAEAINYSFCYPVADDWEES